MKQADSHLHEQLVYEWSPEIRDLFFRPVEGVSYEVFRDGKNIVTNRFLCANLIRFLRDHGYTVNQTRKPGYAAKTRLGDVKIKVERAYSGAKVTHVLVRIAHDEVLQARTLGAEIKQQVLSETGANCVVDNTVFREDC